jgi:hypothetical protein
MISMFITDVNAGINRGRTIEMRNPERMDHRGVDVQVEYETAMDGTVYSTKTTARPDVLEFTFTSVPRLKAQEMRDFVVAAAGYEVRLIDHKGTSWLGKFSQDSFDMTTVERGIGSGVPEFADLEFEFEGKKL